VFSARFTKSVSGALVLFFNCLAGVCLDAFTKQLFLSSKNSLVLSE